MANAFLLKPLVPASLAATAGSVQFSPATLFASGAAGAASWWYDPSDLASMWQDTARTVAAVVDGPVGAIADKSGNGRHWLAQSTSARPTLRQAGGLTWLEFDGSDDGFTVAYAGAAGMDLFTAYRRDAAEAQFLLHFPASNGAYFLAAGTNSTSAADNGSGTPTYRYNRALSDGGGRPTRAQVLAASPSDVAVLLELRDADLSAWTANAVGFYSAFEFRGRFYGSVNVSTALANTADNRVQLEAWLAARAGIAGITAPPLAGSSVTIRTGALPNLLNDYAGVVVEFGDTAQAAIVVDLGADTSIDTVLLFGVELFPAAGSLTVDYATAAQGAFGGTFATDMTGSAYAGSAAMTTGKGVSYWALPAPITARYVRLTYAAAAVMSLRVSRLVIGKRIRLERNYGWGGAFGVRDLGSLDFSRRGVMLRARGAKLRTVGLTFSNVRRDELEAQLQPLLEQLGNTETVALVTDPAADAQRQNRCYFGPLVGDLSATRVNAARAEAKINLVSLF